MSPSQQKHLALVTGVGRRRSIASGIALGLARDGWDLILNHWQPYDERIDLERGEDDPHAIADACREYGAQVILVPGDLGEPVFPGQLMGSGPAGRTVAGLVLAHCESVDSSILTTDIESWDRHFAVNARASWLLVKAFAEVLPVEVRDSGAGRIVALTSDHVAHNLPYGSSKGALDRIVLAAAVELAHLGVRANVVNPGPVDTGWMDDDTRSALTTRTPLGRLGTPDDIADLVTFLMSRAGGWITGQLLHSNGGFDG